MEQTQHYCLHSLLEVQEGHINQFRAMVQFAFRKGLQLPQAKVSSASLHHHCQGKLNIAEYLLAITLKLSLGGFAQVAASL